MKVSVIGLRAYPSEFEGTSGLEVYTEKVVNELFKINKNLKLYFYTKTKYQDKVLNKDQRVRVISLKTINSKVLETLYYSLIASVAACFDRSDIIWYHGAGPAIFSLIPKTLGKKVIVTVHGLDWQRRKWTSIEKALFTLFVNLSFYKNYKTFVVSQDLAEYIKNSFGCYSEIVAPGIDLTQRKPPITGLSEFGVYEGRYLLYLGRIVPEKRIEWLLDEYLAIKDRHKNLKLVIAGGHGNLPDYERKLKKKYSHPDIIWPGYVFGKKKNALLYYSRAFILPSELEGNSISFTEAIGYGLRCVVSVRNAKTLGVLGNVYTFNDTKPSFSKIFKRVISSFSRYKYSTKERLMLSKYTWGKTALSYKL